MDKVPDTTKNRAVIGVGSNIDPDKHIPYARKIIAGDHDLLAESSFVMTKPLGYADQPNFLNGVWLIETKLQLEDLRNYLKQLETVCGRIRTDNPNGPRTLDLDVVVWNGAVIDSDFYQRKFLRQAIRQVLPHLRIES